MVYVFNHEKFVSELRCISSLLLDVISLLIE